MSEAPTLEDVRTVSQGWIKVVSLPPRAYQFERAVLGGGQRNLSLWPCVRQSSSHPLYYHCCFLFRAVCDSFGLNFESRAGGGSLGAYSKMHTLGKL